MKYDLTPLLSAVGIIKEFNALELKDLEFVLDGKPIPVPQGALVEWKYTGLSNKDFLMSFLLSSIAPPEEPPLGSNEKDPT